MYQILLSMAAEPGLGDVNFVICPFSQGFLQTCSVQPKMYDYVYSPYMQTAHEWARPPSLSSIVVDPVSTLNKIINFSGVEMKNLRLFLRTQWAYFSQILFRWMDYLGKGEELTNTNLNKFVNEI